MEQLRAAVDEARTHSGGGMDRLRAFLILYAEINMTAFGRCVILTEDHELMEASRRQFRALKREIDNALREPVREAVEVGTRSERRREGQEGDSTVQYRWLP